jgi:hypothetical protein
MLFLIASTVRFGEKDKSTISNSLDKSVTRPNRCQSQTGKTYIEKSPVYGSDRWDVYRNGRKMGYLERDVIFRDRFHLVLFFET